MVWIEGGIMLANRILLPDNEAWYMNSKRTRNLVIVKLSLSQLTIQRARYLKRQLDKSHSLELNNVTYETVEMRTAKYHVAKAVHLLFFY